MPESGPALVHHLSLLLRVKILADLAHDAQHLTLPGFQQRRILLDEIEDIFLRFARIPARLLRRFFAFDARQGLPQRVHLALQILFAAFLARFLSTREIFCGRLYLSTP